jgi:hypothetical protein
MSGAVKMETGALVFMDALGFKGVWRRPDVADDPTRVIDKLEKVQQGTWEDLRQPFADIPPASLQQFQEAVKVAFISDTVVVAVADTIAPVVIPLLSQQKNFEGREQSIPLNLACIFAAGIIRRMAQRPAPLAMRGSVAWGRFAVSPNFIIGPAVDEAAECAGAAEAAIVWLAPSARKHTEWRPKGSARLIPWAVPMKAGSVYETQAVSPFEIAADDHEQLTNLILDAFDVQRLDVQIKRQNTARFLAKAMRIAKDRGPSPAADAEAK